MSTESIEPAEILPTTESERAPRPFPRWVRDVVVVLIAIAAGFGASYLHPGPRGHVGPRGPQGVQGAQGVAGPAGSAASAQHLGVCLDTSTWTDTSGSVVPPLISNVYIDSPSKSKDGTVSCDAGSFVSVSPQGAK